MVLIYKGFCQLSVLIKGYGCAGGGDAEGGAGADGHGEVFEVAVADGKVVADGDVVVLQVFVEHGVHVVEATVGMFVFGELSDDDALDVRHKPSHLNVVKHAVNLHHCFVGVFYH